MEFWQKKTDVQDCVDLASKFRPRNKFKGFMSRWIIGCLRPCKYARARPLEIAQLFAKPKRGLKKPETSRCCRM